MQALITDGTYKAILDKWSVSAGAITTSEINAAAAGLDREWSPNRPTDPGPATADQGGAGPAPGPLGRRSS